MSDLANDPYNQFLNVLSALSLLVILSMLMERALALLFEYHYFQKLAEKIGEGIKTPIAFLSCLYVCNYIKFDILSRLFYLVVFWSVFSCQLE